MAFKRLKLGHSTTPWATPSRAEGPMAYKAPALRAVGPKALIGKPPSQLRWLKAKAPGPSGLQGYKVALGPIGQKAQGPPGLVGPEALGLIGQSLRL